MYILLISLIVEEHSTFPDLATRLSATLRHAIFTDNVSYRAASIFGQKLINRVHSKVVYPKENRELMIELLREHITGNIVKVSIRTNSALKVDYLLIVQLCRLETDSSVKLMVFLKDLYFLVYFAVYSTVIWKSIVYNLRKILQL